MLSGEATNINFIVFGLTRPGLKPTIYHTRGKHADHYVTDAFFTIYMVVGHFQCLLPVLVFSGKNCHNCKNRIGLQQCSWLFGYYRSKNSPKTYKIQTNQMTYHIFRLKWSQSLEIQIIKWKWNPNGFQIRYWHWAHHITDCNILLKGLRR
jgi:hypothetical protein